MVKINNVQEDQKCDSKFDTRSMTEKYNKYLMMDIETR